MSVSWTQSGSWFHSRAFSLVWALYQIPCCLSAWSLLCYLQQGYQWLKDKILSEEGHRQQVKLKELRAVAERLGCTLPQLAIGKTTVTCWSCFAFIIPYCTVGIVLALLKLFVTAKFDPFSRTPSFTCSVMELLSPVLPVLKLPTAWCLRNEGVNSVLLGASTTDQLMENIRAIQVRKYTG